MKKILAFLLALGVVIGGGINFSITADSPVDYDDITEVLPRH